MTDKQTSIKSLDQLTAAIVAERSKPSNYRSAIVAGIDSEAATVAQLEQSLDPNTIDQLAQAQARHAALSARLESFDSIQLANRETAILDQLCREHATEIAGLLEAERNSRARPSTSYFSRMAEKFAAASKHFFGPSKSPDQVNAAAEEAAKIQADSDLKTYQLSTSESEIARFKSGPCWEYFNSASIAVKSLEFSV